MRTEAIFSLKISPTSPPLKSSQNFFLNQFFCINGCIKLLFLRDKFHFEPFKLFKCIRSMFFMPQIRRISSNVLLFHIPFWRTHLLWLLFFTVFSCLEIWFVFRFSMKICCVFRPQIYQNMSSPISFALETLISHFSELADYFSIDNFCMPNCTLKVVPCDIFPYDEILSDFND